MLPLFLQFRKSQENSFLESYGGDLFVVEVVIEGR